jgi:triacylglycerol lipase
MPITDQDAVDFGFLVAFAEGMYVPNSITPHPEPRIAAAGWNVVGYFIALDSILPDASTLPAGALKTVQFGESVFYGFLARDNADPPRYAAAIRGTNGFAEWVIDADFLASPTPSAAGATVEKGFWSIYNSMTLVGLDGARIGVKAADGIAQVVGATALVTICGHSLGSAIATYLSFDVVKLMGARASACLFASPRTGDQAWAAAFDASVSNYRLMNYVLDAVPYVPPDRPPIAYSTLALAEKLQPASAQAEVRFDLRCNHNLICYCAMIDYAGTKARASAQDAEAWKCIVGPPTFGLNRELTLALATAVNALGEARDDIVRLISAAAKSKGGHV